MKSRLLSGLAGLIFGIVIGVIFIAIFTSILQSASAYEDFVEEVSGGFIKILAVCSLVPAAIFLIVPEDRGWSPKFGLSIGILILILVITVIALIFTTFGVINSIATFFIIAALFSGGGSILVIIIFDR